jgi:hypothetical protein
LLTFKFFSFFIFEFSTFYSHFYFGLFQENFESQIFLIKINRTNQNCYLKHESFLINK